MHLVFIRNLKELMKLFFNWEISFLFFLAFLILRNKNKTSLTYRNQIKSFILCRALFILMKLKVLYMVVLLPVKKPKAKQRPLHTKKS